MKDSKLNLCSADDAVDEALEGLTFINPGLRRLQDHRVIVREQVSTLYFPLISPFHRS